MTTPAATSIMIEVNGAPTTTAASTLDELIATFGHDPSAVATARNGEFVSRGMRAATPLAPGDRIEIVSPRQGG